MDIGYRGLLAPNGFPPHANLTTSPGSSSDLRHNPRLQRPLAASGVSTRTSEPGNMEKTPPSTGKRRGGCRKACNECKQQKLRCDIVQTPADACSRCRRLQIECKVEPSFKRISKRRRNAEMEREIAELRRRLASNVDNAHAVEAGASDEMSQCSEDVYCGPGRGNTDRARTMSTKLEPQALATPLTMHSDRSILSQDDDPWRLEDVSLSRQRVARLFDHFFKFYHPFLPLLNPQKPPEEYLRRCPFQAWTIICVASRRAPSEPGLLSALSGPFSRLLWSTITSVPQDYRIVKGLCLLCTWPLPTTSQRTDATFMLCGLMMQISMQLGLHRPVQAEEFTTFRMEGQGEAVKDRLQTWVICNIVAQNVATGYGQPPGTIYDWALEPASLRDADYHPSEDLRTRLCIEKFCDRVTKSLYSSRPDPTEFISSEKLLIVQLLENELREMELEFGRNISQINMIHLRAAELHMRYFVFLGSNARSDDLTKLFIATTSFLGRVLDLETSPGEPIGHATNYILQMIISAAFALMKLLKSDFQRHIDFEHGKLLFNGAISALRRISVMDHDRPVRLADILAQMWNAGAPEGPGDDTLLLKVRCRMSMSHVYDTVWRWRHRFRPAKGLEDTQATTANPSVSTTAITRQPDGSLEDPGLIYPPTFDQEGAFFSEAGFSEVFDSLNWVFDGLPDTRFVAPPIM
ncbi:transcription factor domain-containing protein [Aspergillus lucknowensis]|uniref:Zn(2)-C6 fungal-type domain-containing protein n=1 Tax=Aspergillus lucknowensis TaxID=176173 RepID=A0ABR4LNA8_9EURO